MYLCWGFHDAIDDAEVDSKNAKNGTIDIDDGHIDDTEDVCVDKMLWLIKQMLWLIKQMLRFITQIMPRVLPMLRDDAETVATSSADLTTCRPYDLTTCRPDNVGFVTHAKGIQTKPLSHGTNPQKHNIHRKRSMFHIFE